MVCSTARLRDKDVVNICTGEKLGCISEFEIETDCGKVTAIIVIPEKLTSLVFSRNLIRIPWECVKIIGKDAVLVELVKVCECHNQNDDCTNDKKRSPWWKF